MNTEVASQWKQGMPDTLLDGVEWRSYNGLEVGLAGRQTMIALKLFAAVDQGPRSHHYQDLVVLAPDDSELERARVWVVTQDASPEFSPQVSEVIERAKADVERDR